MFGSLSEPRPSGVEGHIFASPIDPEAYMVMLVHQNGSLARESVRDACADGSWKTYAAMLEQTQPGNGGNIGLYIDEPEITPPIQKTGRFRFDPDGNAVDSFSPEVEVRACYEGQLMSLRLHAKRIGLEPVSILATGGASVDMSLVSIIANVFGVPIYTGEVAASAALGAAYRALHGRACAEKGSFVSFGDALSGATPFKKACEPDPAAHEAYSGMMDAFEAIEDRVAAQ